MTTTPSFVRTQMLDPKDPPITEKGAVKWVRENLFSGWLNTILTLLSLYVIYWVLAHILPWSLGGIWIAESLTECREIRDASGIGYDVACWAVITDRWHQLLFGFYPSELYWRPILTLILFGAAIAPILFDKAPRQLLIVTAIMPFAAYWLLWGGTIWGPLVTALGFVLGWAVLTYGAATLGALGSIIGAIVVPLLFWLFVAGPLSGYLASLNGAQYIATLVGLFASIAIYVALRTRVERWQAAAIGVAIFAAWWALISPFLGIRIGLVVGTDWGFAIESVASDRFGGFMLAIVIGVAGIVMSLPLGILLALGRQSDLFIINKCSVVFIEVIRGIPLIVWLFTASLLLNYFLPPGTNFDLMLRVIIMVTLFASAYIAEVVRGGLAALPRGQYEGADSLGLDYWQSMQLIILPQALKISIPGIVSTFIGLFKDTTLVVFIGLLDPIGLAGAIRADADWNGIYWELFIFIGLCFFIFCFSMSRYSQWLERKLNTGHR